ncbi:MAG TPA: response regulator transcription factor [Candidatus Acidoferrum sp.]|nr:response regulator transcription factor [Candidatus Acidoferrum sp.]
MKTKILIADDHRLFRDGLRNMLSRQEDLEVVGETTNGPSTVRAVDELKPDLVLMDISMPELNGVEATRRIRTAHPSVRIVVLSMHSDQRFVHESLRAGATGYLLKDCAIEELLSAIRSVMRNQMYLSQTIADSVVKDYINLARNAPTSAFSILSSREREVLQALAEGKTTKEIASQLKISIKTIETHRKQIMDKLDIHSIAELTKYAIREGLTPLE